MLQKYCTMIFNLPPHTTLPPHSPTNTTIFLSNVLLLTFISLWRRYTENGRYLIHYYMLFTPTTTNHIFSISRHTKHISFHSMPPTLTPCFYHFLILQLFASFSRWETLSAKFVTSTMLSCFHLSFSERIFSLHNRIDACDSSSFIHLSFTAFHLAFFFITVYIVHVKTSHLLSHHYHHR